MAMSPMCRSTCIKCSIDTMELCYWQKCLFDEYESGLREKANTHNVKRSNALREYVTHQSNYVLREKPRRVLSVEMEGKRAVGRCKMTLFSILFLFVLSCVQRVSFSCRLYVHLTYHGMKAIENLRNEKTSLCYLFAIEQQELIEIWLMHLN